MPSNGRARPTVMSGRVTSIKDGCIVFKNDRDAHQWVLIGETKNLTAYASRVGAQIAYGDILWAVLNSSEFTLVR